MNEIEAGLQLVRDNVMLLETQPFSLNGLLKGRALEHLAVLFKKARALDDLRRIDDCPRCNGDPDGPCYDNIPITEAPEAAASQEPWR